MSEPRKRRQWKASEKLRIVLSGMEPGVRISELCRREGIQPAQYHNWKSQLVSSAEAVFGDRKRDQAVERAEQRHQEQLRRKDAVIAEITTENLTTARRVKQLKSTSWLVDTTQSK